MKPEIKKLKPFTKFHVLTLCWIKHKSRSGKKSNASHFCVSFQMQKSWRKLIWHWRWQFYNLRKVAFSNYFINTRFRGSQEGQNIISNIIPLCIVWLSEVCIIYKRRVYWLFSSFRPLSNVWRASIYYIFGKNDILSHLFLKNFSSRDLRLTFNMLKMGVHWLLRFGSFAPELENKRENFCFQKVLMMKGNNCASQNW